MSLASNSTASQPDDYLSSCGVGLLPTKDKVLVVILAKLKTLGSINFIPQIDRYLLIVALLPVTLYITLSAVKPGVGSCGFGDPSTNGVVLTLSCSTGGASPP